VVAQIETSPKSAVVVFLVPKTLHLPLSPDFVPHGGWGALTEPGRFWFEVSLRNAQQPSKIRGEDPQF